MGISRNCWIRAGKGLLLAGVIFGEAVAGLPAQRADRNSAPPFETGTVRPFFVGERLVYRVRVARFGTVGQGSMEVQNGETLRNRPTYLLRFDFQTRVGLVSVRDNTKSWLDPVAMAALRFEKEERHPLSNQKQLFDIFPAERRWRAADGTEGTSPSDAPLDELSFIYFIRTLPLLPGDHYRFDRHFQAGRNPVDIRVLRREEITVPAGSFPAVVVEMRVNDQDRFGGSQGLVRFHLTDDSRRIPLQIESSLRVFGGMVLTLESHTHPGGNPASR